MENSDKPNTIQRQWFQWHSSTSGSRSRSSTSGSEYSVNGNIAVGVQVLNKGSCPFPFSNHCWMMPNNIIFRQIELCICPGHLYGNNFLKCKNYFYRQSLKADVISLHSYFLNLSSQDQKDFYIGLKITLRCCKIELKKTEISHLKSCNHNVAYNKSDLWKTFHTLWLFGCYSTRYSRLIHSIHNISALYFCVP